MTLTVLPPSPPTETITFTPNVVNPGAQFQIAQSSTNAQSCTQTGGIPGEDWQGSDQPPAGSSLLQAPDAAGQVTFGLTCQSIDPNTAATSTEATLNVAIVSASLTSSATSVTVGNSLRLHGHLPARPVVLPAEAEPMGARGPAPWGRRAP